MVRLMQMLLLTMVGRFQTRPREERGSAVDWLIVVGAGIAIAYFAGDSVMTFAKSLVGRLGE